MDTYKIKFKKEVSYESIKENIYVDAQKIILFFIVWYNTKNICGFAWEIIIDDKDW